MAGRAARPRAAPVPLGRRGAPPGRRPASDGPLERAVVVVGPEGGLAESEVEAIRAAGAVVAGLGARILRTETAGPVALSLLQFRYGDLGR